MDNGIYGISPSYLGKLVEALAVVEGAKQKLFHRDNDFDDEDRESLELITDGICKLIVRHCKHYGNHSL